jgi:hypothetical protein
MSFRPQFSLRTLLLITALIAVGVNWCIPPNHIIETIDGVEHEYDYYYDWSGKRIKHGVVIERYTEYSWEVSALKVYRHGNDTINEVVLHFHKSTGCHRGQMQRFKSLTEIKDDLVIQLVPVNLLDDERKILEAKIMQEKLRFDPSKYYNYEFIRYIHGESESDSLNFESLE